MAQTNTQKNSRDGDLQQVIRARPSQLEYRKPAKVSGRLIAALIKTLKAFPQAKAAYLTEIQIKNSTEGHVPLIAISAPNANPEAFKVILAAVCRTIGEADDLESPFDVCRAEQLPGFADAVAQGLTRTFYQAA